jgi:iron-sulfur cluster repair protein YtfE (RIC family)
MSQATTARPTVHEMVVVHRMFRREFGLAPVLVRAVAPGDRARAAVVGAHLAEISTMLHHHHTGEDELVWPKLHARTPVSDDLVTRMEAQHEHVGRLLEQLDVLLPAWRTEPGAAQRDALGSVLEAVGPALSEHLDEEEREVLPLVEQHLTVAEWDEVGAKAVAAIPKARMLVLFGYVLEGTSADEQRLMLGVLPPPVRLLYKALGRRKHDRERKAIRAGAVPAQAERTVPHTS